MSQSLKVAIVGAGTAGLAAAIAFRRSGHQVQVYERHESLATQGAGLLIQPQGIFSLAALGVGEEFFKASVPITRLEGKSHRGWTLVDIAYKKQEARGISRSALANLLLQSAIDVGASVIFKAEVEGIDVSELGGCITINGQRKYFDLVVVAGGASTPLAAQADLAVPSTLYRWGALWGMFDVDSWPDEKTLQQRFRTTRQMFGLMPTERVNGKLRLSFFWSLPCDEYAQWKASSLEAWKEELILLWPESRSVVEQICAHDQLTFATYRHAWPSRLAKSSVCVIGDAAHAMSPQLGLGATLAVQDALYLAHYVNTMGKEKGLITFSKKRLWQVYAYQTLSRLLTPCFQSSGGGLWRDVVFAFSLYIPGVRYLMYRSVAEPNSSAKLPTLVRPN